MTAPQESPITKLSDEEFDRQVVWLHSGRTPDKPKNDPTGFTVSRCALGLLLQQEGLGGKRESYCRLYGEWWRLKRQVGQEKRKVLVGEDYRVFMFIDFYLVL